jgi:phage protein D
MPEITLSSNNTIEALQKKYSDFYAPNCEIYIDDTELSKQGIAITDVYVTSSVDMKADAFGFSVVNAFNIENRDFNSKWLKDYFEPGKKVEIKMGYTSALATIIYGVITKVTANYPPNEQPKIEVQGMDKMFLMMKGTKLKTFLKQKHSDIVTAKAGEFGLSTSVEATSLQIEAETQNNESDYEYIRRLANHYNYEFFVLADKLYFRKRHQGSKSEVVTLEWGKTLGSFSVSADLGSIEATKVEVHGYDKKQKKEVVGVSSEINSFGTGSKSGFEFLKTPLNNKDAVKYINDHRISSVEEAKAKANAVLNEIAVNFISGEGESIGIPEIRAGVYIKLDKLGEKFSNVYYVTHATHLFGKNGYVTKFTVCGVKI